MKFKYINFLFNKNKILKTKNLKSSSPLNFISLRIQFILFKLSYFLLRKLLSSYINIKYKPKKFCYKYDDTGLCIEFGGGEKPLKRHLGFLNIDIRSLETVDLVCSSRDVQTKIKPKSVSVIFSRHFLEHLTDFELNAHLNDCKNILNNNGIMEGIIPSTEFHIIQLVCSKSGSDIYKHALAGFNGWQRGDNIGYWDVHKSTFTYSGIRYILNKNGFNVQFRKTNPKNIHFIATKKSRN